MQEAGQGQEKKKKAHKFSLASDQREATEPQPQAPLEAAKRALAGSRGRGLQAGDSGNVGDTRRLLFLCILEVGVARHIGQQ